MIPDLSKGSQTIVNSLVVNPALNAGMQMLIDYGFQGIAQGKQALNSLKNSVNTYKTLKHSLASKNLKKQ